MTINAEITAGIDPVTKNGTEVPVLRIVGNISRDELKEIVDAAIMEASDDVTRATHPVRICTDVSLRSSGENVVNVYASGATDTKGYQTYFGSVKRHLER